MSILEPGDIVSNKYEVVEVLCSSNSKDVYLCNHKDLSDQQFVLKVLKSEVAENEKVLMRFENEMKAALKVSHKNVVRAFELIKEDGLVAYTMEYVDGGNLHSQLERYDTVPIDVVKSYLIQILKGTAALHEEGIVHRDLKPGNILLTKNDQIKISDFGISIFEQQTRLTDTGKLVGSPNYIAPEYIQDNIVHEQTDIYSIGIIGYEMITRRLPFTGRNIYELLKQKLNTEPHPPKAYRPDCPNHLSECITKAIFRDPEKRHESCEQMIDYLENPEKYPTEAVEQSSASDIPDTVDPDDYDEEFDGPKKTTADKVKDLEGSYMKYSVSYKNEVVEIDHPSEKRERKYTNKLKTSAVRDDENLFLLLGVVLGLSVVAIAAFFGYEFFYTRSQIQQVDHQAAADVAKKKLEKLRSARFRMPDEVRVIKNVDGSFIEGKLFFKSSVLKNLEIKLTHPPDFSRPDTPQLMTITLTNVKDIQAKRQSFQVIGAAQAEIWTQSETTSIDTDINIHGSINDNNESPSVTIKYRVPSNLVTDQKKTNLVTMEEENYQLMLANSFVLSKRELK